MWILLTALWGFCAVTTTVFAAKENPGIVTAFDDSIVENFKLAIAGFFMWPIVAGLMIVVQYDRWRRGS